MDKSASTTDEPQVFFLARQPDAAVVMVIVEASAAVAILAWAWVRAFQTWPAGVSPARFVGGIAVMLVFAAGLGVAGVLALHFAQREKAEVTQAGLLRHYWRRAPVLIPWGDIVGLWWHRARLQNVARLNLVLRKGAAQSRGRIIPATIDPHTAEALRELLVECLDLAENAAAGPIPDQWPWRPTGGAEHRFYARPEQTTAPRADPKSLP